MKIIENVHIQELLYYLYKHKFISFNIFNVFTSRFLDIAFFVYYFLIIFI